MRRGFTLIELLIVVAIIGILATMVIINVAGARNKAFAVKNKDDITTVYKTAQLFVAMGGDVNTLENLGLDSEWMEDQDVQQLKNGSEVMLQKAPTRGTGDYYQWFNWQSLANNMWRIVGNYRQDRTGLNFRCQIDSDNLDGGTGCVDIN